MNGNSFYLMHKNDIVTVLEMDSVSGHIVKIASRVQSELLPPGGSLSKESLRKWWGRRAVPLSQGRIEWMLRDQGIATPQKYLVQNYGLSLSDHYWIKPVESILTWEQVNLYENEFKEDVSEFQIISGETYRTQIDLCGKTSFYPSASLQGELRKKWMIHNKKRYLIKGNYGVSCQQSINEVIASMLHKMQNTMPYTEYRLCAISVDGHESIGCMSENFTDEQIEFIPAYDVVSSHKKKNDMSEYEHFIRICIENGLDENQVRNFLEYQILTDFVLTNTDRHFNNFGVLRDSASLKYVGMAPIFDSGNCLFWDCPELPQRDTLLNISVRSFRKKETDLLRCVQNRDLVNIEKLPTDQQVADLLEKNKGFENTIDGILLGYKKKKDLLEQLQSGKEIWKYAYRK